MGRLTRDQAVARLLDGIQAEMSASGIDVGAMADIGGEEIEPLPEATDLPPEATAGVEAGAAPV